MKCAAVRSVYWKYDFVLVTVCLNFVLRWWWNVDNLIGCLKSDDHINNCYEVLFKVKLRKGFLLDARINILITLQSTVLVKLYRVKLNYEYM